MGRGRRIFRAVAWAMLGIAAWAAAAGCRHASGPPATGAGSFVFVSPAPPPETKTEAAEATPSPGDVVIEPEPVLPLAKPVYPRQALAAPRGLVNVGVRITIDTQGRVSAIGSSLATFSSPNAFTAGFRDAVEDAVKQWRFHPARIQHVESAKGANGGEVLMMTDGGKAEWSFDVAFTFTASGDVLSGLPGQGRGPIKEAFVPQRVRAFFVRLFGGRVLGNGTP